MEYFWSQDGQTAQVTVTELTQADPLPTLVALEKQLGDQDIKQMQLTFSAGLTPPKERLEKLGFQPHATDVQLCQQPTTYLLANEVGACKSLS